LKVKDWQKFQKAIDTVYESAKYKEIRTKMDRYLKYFQGDFWGQHSDLTSPGDSKIFVNYIFSTVMTIMPLLTDNRPTWYVRARKAHHQRYLNIFNDALDYLWDVLELDMELSHVVLVSLIQKVGIWEIYWDTNASPTGKIGVDLVDPRTFVIAPGYDDPWKAPWCGTFGPMPLTWVWQYFPEKAEEVTGNVLKGQSYDKDKWGDEDAVNHVVNVYKIFVRDDTVERALDAEGHFVDEKGKKTKKYPNGRYMIFTENVKLKDVACKTKHGKAPFVAFYDYWNPFEFHGMGEPDQIESMNLEFNLLIKRVANYSRRFTGLNVYKSTNDGIPDEKFKAEIIKGDDNVWALQNDADPPKSMEFKPINRTILDFIAAIPKMIEEVSAVTEVSKGIDTKKERRTAAEYGGMLESSYTRTRQRVRNLETAIKRTCYLFVSMMQQFYTEPRPVVTRRGGEASYGTVTSNPRYLKEQLAPPANPQRETEEDDKLYEQHQQDYEKFFEEFGGKDSVYADFDIEIQTNSTLPMDKQSLANLFLRLFELKAVDQLSLLKQLRIPNAEEIVQRTQAAEQPQPIGVPNG